MSSTNAIFDIAFTEIAGRSLCSAVRYRLTSIPRVHYCHCDMCRRATSSAFAVLAWISFDHLFWTSGRPKYRRSSQLAERRFCEDCGSPLTLAYDAVCSSADQTHDALMELYRSRSASRSKLCPPSVLGGWHLTAFRKERDFENVL
ncbi:GFA family protein [Mesorhizobium metallidurans]|uniref:GFA family protein n=1 Tax=Mesorhizobium metallidurans TaxID=489722 RepID=UPI0009FD23CE